MGTYLLKFKKRTPEQIIFMKKILFFTFAFLSTSLVFAQMDFGQSRVKTQSFLDTIPFIFENNSIIITIEIQGQQGNFILDTGAPTVLSKSFQTQLKLAPTGSIRVRAANRQVQEQDYTLIPELNIHQIDFINVPALVMDLAQTPLKDSPIQIDGIIGSNQLKDVVLQIDFAQKILVFSDKKEHLDVHKTKGIKMKLDKSYRPFIPVNVSGKKTEVLFDTGFNGLYAMPIEFYHFHKKYFLKYALKKGGATSAYTSIYGETNEEDLPLIRCPYLKIGAIELQKVVTLPYPGQEALLGMELLEEGVVTLDYLKRRFYFQHNY